ncbi:MAG TPA: winged helix-turn-helix domain-containing protein [Candidatus Limnocylindria bacterium]|nr:winged helix-turn-helix domain-containing protein [Candidatus Limnocylindria bacterium]
MSAGEPSPWMMRGPYRRSADRCRGERSVPTRKAIGIELLADPTRRRIVALIGGRVRHPAQIASAIGLSRPAVSRQLRLLTEAGLIRWTWSNLDRRSRVYIIDPAMQAPIIAWLAGVDLTNVRPFFSPYWSAPAQGANRIGASTSGPAAQSSPHLDRSASLEPS